MTLEIDGSQGEGGGQVLRTSLSLSMCTGTPIRIRGIRAKRSRPGLMRQHLTAVRAAARVCGAVVEGDKMGSQELRFTPGKIRGGDYRFAIGTAGSCTLVLQTLLPALLQADTPSDLQLQGGTHNPLAPPFHFLERAFVPLLQRMGVEVTLKLERYGFYPVGGGVLTAAITPAAKLQPLQLDSRGERIRAYAESYIAALPLHIAQRELDTVRKRLGWCDDQLLLRGLANNEGPGNALLITLEHANVTEVFTAFGKKGVTAEAVAESAIDEALHYLASDAAVGPHLADQLLLPMALTGGGSFTTTSATQHALTNAEIIRQFLPLRITMEQQGTLRFAVRIGPT